MLEDQELRALVSVDPSPEFVARIRTTIATQPARTRWFSWWQPAIAVAALSFMVIVAVRSVGDDETMPIRSGGSVSWAPTADAVPMHRPEPPLEVRPVRVSVRSAVQIDRLEAEALRRLFAAPPTVAVSAAPAPADAMKIPELSIAPLAQATVVEGESK
jgi:hypothetical protein